MCAVSQVGDYWKDGFQEKYPRWVPSSEPGIPITNSFGPVTKADFDKLSAELKAEFLEIKTEILALKELLKAAIKYDEITAQPHCENEDKIALIKKVAEMVGVDLTDLNLND